MIWFVTLALHANGAPATGTEQMLVSELNRAWEQLQQEEEPPHYTALAVRDQTSFRMAAEHGLTSASTKSHQRLLDVDLRVGSPILDSTHPLRGFSTLAGKERPLTKLPLKNGMGARLLIWRTLDQTYRDAAETIIVVRANQTVKAEEEDLSNDFEPRQPVVERIEVKELPALSHWQPLLNELSQTLSSDERVEREGVSLFGERRQDTFVDTEGTRITHGRLHARIAISVSATAPDGDPVSVYKSVDVKEMDRLPSPGELQSWTAEVLTDLHELLDAPRAAPYSGPVLLGGQASGVFFHEVLGHRVEGHRQKRDDEGKTFASSIGEPILPPFISVVDDPTLSELAGEQLNGYYQFDDEGVKASAALLVKDGLFQGFLMQRSPIPGFEHSNGHGRRAPGNAPKSRMANTIVQASKQVSTASLRERLRAQAKAQGLPYGYYIDSITGGFTMTGRVMPNAFNVRASSLWRVFVDGRPDERVRGLDLVGTPFVAFKNLLAAGDIPEVFNGQCGAESGWVPVSAVSPMLLFKTLEFQRKEKGQETPPLLPKPGTDAASDGGVQ